MTSTSSSTARFLLCSRMPALGCRWSGPRSSRCSSRRWKAFPRRLNLLFVTYPLVPDPRAVRSPMPAEHKSNYTVSTDLHIHASCRVRNAVGALIHVPLYILKDEARRQGPARRWAPFHEQWVPLAGQQWSAAGDRSSATARDLIFPVPNFSIYIHRVCCVRVHPALGWQAWLRLSETSAWVPQYPLRSPKPAHLSVMVWCAVPHRRTPSNRCDKYLVRLAKKIDSSPPKRARGHVRPAG